MNRLKIYLFLCLSISLFSCESLIDTDTGTVQHVESLGTEVIEVESNSRTPESIESLYEKLVDGSPELKKLETDIRTLQGKQDDSTLSFRKYDNMSESYYSSALRLVSNIQDSVLKTQLNLMLQNSQEKYNKHKSDHQKLITDINKKAARLDDLHNALKLIKTLPIMERYQRTNMPPLRPLTKLPQDFDNQLQVLDSMAKK